MSKLLITINVPLSGYHNPIFFRKKSIRKTVLFLQITEKRGKDKGDGEEKDRQIPVDIPDLQVGFKSAAV